MNTTVSFIEMFFEQLSLHDSESVKRFWHEEGSVYINNDQKSIDFISNTPPYVGFNLKQVVVIHHSMALDIVKVDWDMTFPGGGGQHESYISIIKNEDALKIITMIDFGQ